jgi:hypothetical protein
MIVDDDPVVVDESIKFSFNNVNNEVVLVNNTSTLSTDVNEQPVADKHHMTSLLFCLPHYRIKVFSSVVNFSGILFADA